MLVLALLMVSQTHSALAAQTELNVALDASALEENGQLNELRYYLNAAYIGLNDMLLIEDDAPACGVPEEYPDSSWVEFLHDGITVKKEFMLDDARAFNGYLVFKATEVPGNAYPLNISVNGVAIQRLPTKQAFPLAKQYIDKRWSRWFYVEIPVGALKEGKNEVLFKTDSPSANWIIHIAVEEEFKRGSLTRIHHPDRSAKSVDNGATWNYDALGQFDRVDGEYCIRLSLDRSVPNGIYTSPVIDLADTTGNDTIKKRVDMTSCRAKWDIDMPEGTNVSISARFGKSPVFSDEDWSPYKEIRVGELEQAWNNPQGRYFQFKVEMTTENPLATPSFKGFSAHSGFTVQSDSSHITTHITGMQNGHIVRPSYKFTNEDFLNEDLHEFRRHYELDKHVAGAASEFEVMLRLLRWAYKIPVQPAYSWNFSDIAVTTRDENGAIILQSYDQRRRDAMCLFSNQVLMGALLSFGFTARHTNIHSEGVSGHEITEVWSNDFNKWIHLDATRDYYAYDPETGVPLNILEMHNRLLKLVPRVETWQRPFRFDVKSDSLGLKADIAYREGENNYSIRDIKHAPHLLLTMGHFRSPMRNDFMSNPLPVPVRQGLTAWGWDGFLHYFDKTFPRRREYQRQTERRQDYYWTLNQSELTVTETDQPDILRVDIDTVTPCFKTFLIQADRNEWAEHQSSTFEWHLHEGINTLDIRACNTLDVPGPVSTVTVVMNR